MLRRNFEGQWRELSAKTKYTAMPLCLRGDTASRGLLYIFPPPPLFRSRSICAYSGIAKYVASFLSSSRVGLSACFRRVWSSFYTVRWGGLFHVELSEWNKIWQGKNYEKLTENIFVFPRFNVASVVAFICFFLRGWTFVAYIVMLSCGVFIILVLQ